MTEIAFFRLPDGRAWIGEGPFAAMSEPAAEGGSFLITDFDLSDPLPWKRPSRLIKADAANIATWAGEESPAVKVQWEKPPTEWFKMAFRRIRREVLAGRLAKMVPALTEKGRLLQGSPLSLLRRVLAAPPNVWGYGHVNGESGFVGATPELLFHLVKDQLGTMALAGTAKPGNLDAFLADVKEIEEHELVARYLVERLGAVAEVRRGERTVMETSGLVHFQSLVTAELNKSTAVGELIRLLHPTPAVGCLPRSDEWLAKLREYRAMLKAPAFFGSPFGFSLDGETHVVVAIRGLGWAGGEVSLPSGCGIVGGSAFDHEWRELRLKREAVTRMFGV